MRLLSWFLITFLSTALLLAQEVEFNPLGREVPIEALEKNLRIRLDWYEIEQSDLMELLAEESASDKPVHISSNATPLLERVKNLIQEEKATHLECSIVTCRSGQRAKVESIQEFIYPTEYDPPGMSLDADDEDAPVTSVPNPTAFETRNLGTTVEVDPVLGADERTVDLNLAPEMVYLVDQENYGTHRVGETEVDIVMPTFYTIKLTTQLTMIAGEPYFAGAMTPFNEKEQKLDRSKKVLLFIQTDLIYTGLPLATDTETETATEE